MALSERTVLRQIIKNLEEEDEGKLSLPHWESHGYRYYLLHDVGWTIHAGCQDWSNPVEMVEHYEDDRWGDEYPLKRRAAYRRESLKIAAEMKAVAKICGIVFRRW